MGLAPVGKKYLEHINYDYRNLMQEAVVTVGYWTDVLPDVREKPQNEAVLYRSISEPGNCIILGMLISS